MRRGVVIMIELVPSELDPGDICVIIKFIQEFQEQGFILGSDINNAQATFIFRSTSRFPCCQIGSFSVDVSIAPKAMLPIFINLCHHLWRKHQTTHVISWHYRKDRVYKNNSALVRKNFTDAI